MGNVRILKKLTYVTIILFFVMSLHTTVFAVNAPFKDLYAELNYKITRAETLEEIAALEQEVMNGLTSNELSIMQFNDLNALVRKKRKSYYEQGIQPGEIINPDDYKPDTLSSDDTELLFAKAGFVVGAIQSVGSIAAVGILMLVGIKYMLGSTEEKAAYKKTIQFYVLGAILLFAGVNIVSAIYKIASTFNA